MKLKKILLLFGVGAFLTPCGFSADEDKPFDVSIRLLDSESLQKVATNFDVAGFASEITAATKIIDPAVAELGKSGRRVAVRIVCFPDKKFTLQLFGRPSFTEEESTQFFKNTKDVHFSKSNEIPLRFELHYVNKNAPKLPEDLVWPEGSAPVYVQRREAFEKANIKEKVSLLQNWARNEVLPILSAYQRSVDPKFEGVLGVGKLLKETDFNKQMNVDKLLNSNFDYWRGMLEMGKGNPLVTSSRIFMEIANGNIAEAKTFTGLHRSFLNEETVAGGFIQEFISLYSILEDAVNHDIKAGIADFDKGDFKAAEAKLEAVLTDFPKNPWARYELWFTRGQIDQSDKNREKRISWNDVSRKIYSMDSMYPIAAEASNEREAFELFCRLEMKSMKPPGDQEEFQQYLIDYADLAFDLNIYPWAAEAYWLIVGNFEPETYEKRPLSDFMIYSILQMGNEEILKVFPKDPKESKRRKIDRMVSGL